MCSTIIFQLSRALLDLWDLILLGCFSYSIKFSNSVFILAVSDYLLALFKIRKDTHMCICCVCPRTTWKLSITHLQWEREAPSATWLRLLWSSYCKGMSSPSRTTHALSVRFTALWPLIPACCSVVIKWSSKDCSVSIICIQKTLTLTSPVFCPPLSAHCCKLCQNIT